MSLLYGWDITVPKPGSVESPDSAAEKWLDNFCYLEGALGVSGASGGSSGGHHVFPGTYLTTAGKHIPGRSALTYVSASTDEPTGVANAVWFDTSYVVFRYYHATSGWTEAVDFFPASLPTSVLYNIAFAASGGSVDGRNYYADGAKLDLITEYSRHMVVITGTAGSGEALPWPIDNSYLTTSGENMIVNGEFGYYPDHYTKLLLSADGVGHWSTVFTDSSSANNVMAGSAMPASALSAYARVSTELSMFGTGAIRHASEDGGVTTRNSSFVYTASSDDFSFGTDPLTVDFRVYFTVAPSAIGNCLPCFYQSYKDANDFFTLYMISSGTEDTFKAYQVISGTSNTIITVDYTDRITPNTWHHIAFIRGWHGDSDSWAVLVDGDIVGASASDTATVSTHSPLVELGRYKGGTAYSAQQIYYIDEYRVSKGIARWTDPFTPAASAYKYDGNGMITNFGWSTATSATLTTVSGGYAGSCAKVVGGSADDHIFQDVSDITPGGSYRYQFYVKSASAGSGYYNQFHGLYDTDNSSWIVTFTDIADASAWTHVTQDFVAPAGCSAVRIYLGASSASATSYFDEVELYRRVYPEVRPASAISIIDGPNKLLADSFWDDASFVKQWYPNMHHLRAGRGGLSPLFNQFHMALRFEDIRVPRGAIIEQAYLRMRCHETVVGGMTEPGSVYVYNTASCGPWPPNGNDFMNFPWVLAGSMPALNYTIGTWYNSSDLSSAVQQITDRSDWDEGNDIGFRMYGPYRHIIATSYHSSWTAASSDPGSGPKLYITYSTSAGESVKIAESLSSVISVREASTDADTSIFTQVECYLDVYEHDGMLRKVVCRGYEAPTAAYVPGEANYMHIACLELVEGDIT